MEEINSDLLIIGTGVAGSYAAFHASRLGAKVALVTKTKLLSGSTPLAQGGIAFPADHTDVPSHLMDTIEAGRGLVDERVSRAILDEALDHLEHLTKLGIEFDASRALEGGHSRPRVLHINGDESGLHLLSFLHKQLERQVHIYEELFAAKLLSDENAVHGAVFWRAGDPSKSVAIRARATVIATGGIGQIYGFTSNPNESTGDGIALAYRSGATVRDMELVQFHPTVLPNGSLITEACRGEGATLLNNKGERFMMQYDPAAELAPRDIVSRSIYTEIRKTGKVCLDLRPIEDLEHKFPTVYSSVISLGIDPLSEPVPVRPAAHFLMGGISTDEYGATSLDRLFSAGEAASTGFHGANRLASNSLLEGLVMGARTAERALECKAGPEGASPANAVAGCTDGSRDLIRQVMDRSASVVRNSTGLNEARKEISRIPITSALNGSEAEVANMRLIALMVIKGALLRQESRGSHFRSDFVDTYSTPAHVDQQILLPNAVED